MMRLFALALVLPLGSGFAFAEEDEDKVPEADMAKLKAALTDLGCTDGEHFKKEAEGIYEIDDAKQLDDLTVGENGLHNDHVVELHELPLFDSQPKLERHRVEGAENASNCCAHAGLSKPCR